MRQPIWRLPDL